MAAELVLVLSVGCSDIVSSNVGQLSSLAD